jgi:Flp pilus assembly protein TadG
VNASKQRGVTVVEMAIVAALAMVVLFGVIEIARLFFVVNALEEATRRGARVAVVCQVNDPAIQRITIFNDSADSGPSAMIGNLTPANIRVDYLADDGSVVADPMADFFAITFARVEVNNYQHQLLIPFFFRNINLPSFATTLPRESLGVTREGFTTC